MSEIPLCLLDFEMQISIIGKFCTNFVLNNNTLKNPRKSCKNFNILKLIFLLNNTRQRKEIFIKLEQFNVKQNNLLDMQVSLNILKFYTNSQ